MRSNEMKEGRLYALSVPGREEPLQVTLISLERPSRTGWVTVRLEEGITARRKIEVSTRRVLAEWGKHNQPRRRRKAKPRKVVDRSPLRAGENVCWPEESGDIEWKLVSIENGIGRIKGRIFGQRQTHEVPIEALERPVSSGNLPPVPDLAAQEEVEPEGECDEEAGIGLDEAGLDLPEDFVPRLMERAVFDSKLLQRYRARWAWKGSKVPPAKQLRRDLKRRGRVVRRRRPISSEYLRIRVGRRYEVIVPHSPSQSEFITLKQIVAAPKPRSRKQSAAKPRPKKGRRRRAA